MIGNGVGAWDIPVGGIGALTGGLVAAAGAAGAELRTGVEVTAIEAGMTGPPVRVSTSDGEELPASHVLANVAPLVLARLLGAEPSGAAAPEGSQLKLNMVLTRLPRLRYPAVAAEDAFAGTFHVNESYSQLAAAFAQAAAGTIPDPVPAEAYCHSLTDPTILGPSCGPAARRR